jgi:FkbM family methyltransferase
LDWILRNLGNGGIFVDVGANIGGYTVRSGGGVGKVYAFEPHARNYTYLKRNVYLNRLRNVKTYNKAISDRAGRVNLFLSPFHGRNTLLGGGEFVQVDAVTMDSMFDCEDEINMIKLDVEGA